MRLWPLPLLLLASAHALAADATKLDANWAQWRGPTGQGYSGDKSVPLKWGEKENLLWQAELPGGGNSSPIVWGERVFLTAADGADRLVLCFSLKDGKELWRQKAATGVPREATHAWNGHASPSCVTDGKHVWAFFGSPGAFCYTVEGKKVWEKKFGTFYSKAGWGTAASPFLYGDTVILNCDNDGGPGGAPAALIALDKTTGKQMWKTPRDQGRGFSTPRLMKGADGRVGLVLNGPAGVWGYDPATGKELWRIRREDRGEKAKFGEPMPVDDGQKMFILSGRPGPFQIAKLPGKGDVTSTHVVYSGTRAKGNHRDVSSPILVDGRVYIADRNAILTCYELATGKELYSAPLGRRGAKSLSSPVLVRGKLLFLLDNGNTVVVEPGPKYKEVGQNKLGKGGNLEFGASPAVADGKLLLRSQTRLYCVGEKK